MKTQAKPDFLLGGRLWRSHWFKSCSQLQGGWAHLPPASQSYLQQSWRLPGRVCPQRETSEGSHTTAFLHSSALLWLRSSGPFGLPGLVRWRGCAPERWGSN